MPRQPVTVQQRFHGGHRCPVCGGASDDPPGNGVRCWGFLSDDRHVAFCTREELRGHLAANGHSGTFAHVLIGDCACGQRHDSNLRTAIRQHIAADRNNRDGGRGRITRYELKNADGEIVAIHLRRDMPDGKEFWFELPDGTRALGGRSVASLPLDGVHRLAEVPTTAPIFITEGEKARRSLTGRGIWAVGTVTGAAAIPDDDALRPLLGRPVILWPDADEPGRRHMERIGDRLRALGHTNVRTFVWAGAPDGGDAFDFFAAGGTAEQFREMLDDLPTETAPEQQDDDDRVDATNLPQICVTDRRLTAKTRDALRALARANAQETRVFQQGGLLVRLRRDEDGAPRVEVLTTDSMRGELDRVAVWVKETKFGPMPTDPPTSVVRDVLSQPVYGLAPLRGISEIPFFSRTGRLVVEAGYHADTGILYAPGLVIPAVPERPSAEDLRRATVLLLEEMLLDFPFVDQASRAHAVGLIILPFVRDLIFGATPNHAVDAPMPGTGKGLLVETVALLSTGRSIEIATESTSDEEIRKRITALFLAGAPFALVDNATHRIDSPILAAALTATRWTDRILGASRMVSMAVRTTFIVTGNNLEFSREHLRRAVWIRLDASTGRPHLRTGFRHHPLGSWVVAHRAELIWSALVLVQHWVAEGRPRFTARTLGSYEAWAEVIGGILRAAGIDGFLDNLDSFAQRADGEGNEWERFVRSWHELHGTRPVSVPVLYPLAATYLPDVLGGGGEHSQRSRLGRAVRRRTDSILADFRIVAVDGFRDELRRLRAAWKLVPLTNAPEVGEAGEAGNTVINRAFTTSPTSPASPSAPLPATSPRQPSRQPVRPPNRRQPVRPPTRQPIQPPTRRQPVPIP